MHNPREDQTHTRTASTPPLPDASAPDSRSTETIAQQQRSGEQATETAGLSSDPAMAEQGQPIAISRALGRVIVTIQAGLDGNIATALHQVLVDLVDNQGNLDVALEFRSVSPIAVESVALIAEIAERVRLHGGMLSVNRPPPALQAMLEDAGVTFR